MATSPTLSLLSGGVAGCVGKTATAPLQRLTVLAQTSTLLGPARLTTGSGKRSSAPNSRTLAIDASVVNGVRRIFHKEGVLALWKGNGCTCLHRFPFAGVNFAVFEYCRSPECIGDSTAGRFASGAMAGCAAVVACYPLDLVRTRIMAQRGSECYRGIGDCIAQTLRSEGPRGMYRGMGTTLALTAPSLSVSFGVYGLLKDVFRARGFPEKSPAATVMAGGTAGAVGAAVIFPMDVLRRRLQVMGMTTPGASVPQRSLREEAAHVLRTEGVQGFFSGFRPEMLRTFPMVAITFLAFELMRP